LNILNRFSKKKSNIKFHEIRLAAAELFHAEGDMTQLNVAFHNSAKAPKSNATVSLNC